MGVLVDSDHPQRNKSHSSDIFELAATTSLSRKQTKHKQLLLLLARRLNSSCGAAASLDSCPDCSSCYCVCLFQPFLIDYGPWCIVCRKSCLSVALQHNKCCSKCNNATSLYIELAAYCRASANHPSPLPHPLGRKIKMSPPA